MEVRKTALTGKNHCHVMEAIRKMESSWEKVCGSNFRLTSRIVDQPNGGTREVPCYSLTRTECLYIATKFNDEARARLVLRWQELELQEQEGRQQLCLPSPARARIGGRSCLTAGKRKRPTGPVLVGRFYRKCDRMITSESS